MGAEFEHTDPERSRRDAGPASLAPAAPAPGVGVAAYAVAELEAERTAAAVVRRLAVGAEGGPAGSDVEELVRAESGRGRPLAPEVRGPMESAFGADLGHVRLHSGPRATAANDRIMARAFTLGSDIFFRGETPDASTPDGQHLLAHELAHVAQQDDGARRTVRRILQTRLQLESAVGKAKGNIGPLIKRDREYKAVLAALDAYHVAVQATVQDASFDQDVQAMKAAITAVENACTAYATAGEDDNSKPERVEWVDDLKDSAGAEKTRVDALAGNKANLVGKTWAQVLPTIGGEDGGLRLGSQDAVVTLKNPGLPGLVTADTELCETLDTTTGALGGKKEPLAADSPVLIHDTDHPTVARVETYNPDHGVGQFRVKKSGYVVAKSVKVGDKVKHAPIGEDVPIFLRVPQVDDVRQGGLGDCYLIAALGAIVANRPQDIYDMIDDNHDGTVTVRLYRPKTEDTPTTRVLIRIEKSLVTGRKRAQGAPWVALIEKAYAALGVSGGGSKSYAQMSDGGGSDVAFEVLTGQPSTRTAVPHATEGQPFWHPVELKKPVDKTRVAKEVFPDQLPLAEKAMAFFGKNGTGPVLDKFRSLDQFEAYFEEQGLPAKIGQPILNAMSEFYPGARGSNVYTRLQRDLFKGVSDHLASGGVATASTKRKIQKESGSAEGTGTSREQITEGLAGQHAYTIVSAFERTTEEGKPARKFLRLRNPWGEGSKALGRGRVYEGGPDGPLELVTDVDELEKLARPEFDIEFTDFTTQFEWVFRG